MITQISKNVTGTVMVNLPDGAPKFLVYNDENPSFLLTNVIEERTMLGSILLYIKKSSSIHLENLSLMELSNTRDEDENLPFFLFQLEASELPELQPGFYWKKASELVVAFQKFKMSTTKDED
ncbi:MAG: hypothetical protein LBD38_02210 [Streptococcaceae bacterium]|jgi:hypothetical protein|nr:hypothetical protein [Streptococcaceae bacterium]